MRIEALWTPSELDAVALSGRAAAAVDVIRATTTILAALEAGARRVLPVASRAEARSAAREAGTSDPGGKAPLLCGERGGRRMEGFDHGNSPRELAEAEVEGRTLLFTTTNGTPLLRRLAAADEVVLACFRNLSAVARRLAQGARDVVIACAGKEGRPGLDDIACAGHLVRAVRRRRGEEAELGDGARDALAVAGLVGEADGDWLASTAAGHALVEIGLEEDLRWCAEMDASLGVPVLRDGEVRLAGTPPSGSPGPAG